MLYNIYAGLAGSFGDAKYKGTADCQSCIEAEELAYQYAVEEYNSYSELYGLLTQEEAEEQAINEGYEPDTDEFLDYINELFQQDMEDWICYYATPTSEDTEIQEIEMI